MTTAPGGGRVLVVDDSPVNRMLLGEALTAEGHTPVTAENGLQALELLWTSDRPPVDAVLLDLEMPELDGYETLSRIKADDRFHDLPVIVISSNDELDSVVRCIEIGATDYLPKPFNTALLRARLNASLAEKRLGDQRRAISDVLRAVAGRKASSVCSTRSSPPRGRSVTATTPSSTCSKATVCRSMPKAAPGSIEHRRKRIRSTASSVVGRTALEREVVQIPDVAEDPDYAVNAQNVVGYRALLGAPIVLDGDLIGAVTAGRNVPGPFTDEQVELVKTFADQAAIAIANTRLIDAVERQRTELSRFLSPQVAELVSSDAGEQLARRPPGVHLLSVLRPARLHGVRGHRRPRGAVRGAPRIPRDARGPHPRLRGDAGALRRRRRSGLFQRPCPGRGARAPGDPVRARGPGALRGAGERRGRNGESGCASGSGSRPGTRLWPHRLRGTLRLRRAWTGGQPRVATQHPRRRRTDPDRPASPRRGRERRRLSARRRARAQGVRTPGHGVRRGWAPRASA